MMGVQIWRGMVREIHPGWQAPEPRINIGDSDTYFEISTPYYKRIDALTAQGVKFP